MMMTRMMMMMRSEGLVEMDLGKFGMEKIDASLVY